MARYTLRAVARYLVFLTICKHLNAAPKIEQIERKIQMLAGVQRLDNLDIKANQVEILSRLTDLEILLNESVSNSESCKAQDPHRTDKPAQAENVKNNGDLIRLVQAFQEEKAVSERLRRQMPDLTKRVDVLDNYAGVLKNVCSKLDMKEVFQLTQSLHIELDILKGDIQNITTEISAIKRSEQNIELQMENVAKSIQSMNSEYERRFADIDYTLESILQSMIRPSSCLSIYENGETLDGVYTVYLSRSMSPLQVYCDMTTDGGGWTVFQRRIDGSVDFFRGWQDYKQGFGNPMAEFWLGNEYIASLSRDCCKQLRIELEDFEGHRGYAKYSIFQVFKEEDNYRLLVEGYLGDVGDAMLHHNGAPFTTKDRDNDDYSANCAVAYTGAWWYGSCHHSNLNGLYLEGKDTLYGKGINWKQWRGHYYSLKMTEMKMK